MKFKKKKSLPTHPSLHIAGIITERDGKWQALWNAPKLIQHFLKENGKIGGHVSATLVCKKPTRSLNQNSFMHVYFGLIALGSGHTMIQIKTWAKGRFLTTGISEVFGHKTRVVKSTASLTIGECVEFMNRIQDVTDVPIPDPEEFSLPMTLDEFGRLKEVQEKKYKKLKPKLKGI